MKKLPSVLLVSAVLSSAALFVGCQSSPAPASDRAAIQLQVALPQRTSAQAVPSTADKAVIEVKDAQGRVIDTATIHQPVSGGQAETAVFYLSKDQTYTFTTSVLDSEAEEVAWGELHYTVVKDETISAVYQSIITSVSLDAGPRNSDHQFAMLTVSGAGMTHPAVPVTDYEVSYSATTTEIIDSSKIGVNYRTATGGSVTATVTGLDASHRQSTFTATLQTTSTTDPASLFSARVVNWPTQYQLQGDVRTIPALADPTLIASGEIKEDGVFTLDLSALVSKSTTENLRSALAKEFNWSELSTGEAAGVMTYCCRVMQRGTDQIMLGFNLRYWDPAVATAMHVGSVGLTQGVGLIYVDRPLSIQQQYMRKLAQVTYQDYNINVNLAKGWNILISKVYKDPGPLGNQPLIEYTALPLDASVAPLEWRADLGSLHDFKVTPVAPTVQVPEGIVTTVEVNIQDLITDEDKFAAPVGIELSIPQGYEFVGSNASCAPSVNSTSGQTVSCKTDIYVPSSSSEVSRELKTSFQVSLRSTLPGDGTSSPLTFTVKPVSARELAPGDNMAEVTLIRSITQNQALNSVKPLIDITPPEIKLNIIDTLKSNQSNVVTGDVQDNNQIAKVECYLGGQKMDEQLFTYPSGVFTCNLVPTFTGNAIITVVAFDGSGNTATGRLSVLVQ